MSANESTNTPRAGARTKAPGAWILAGLLVLAAAIFVLSLLVGTQAGGEFGGADGQAEDTVGELQPDYEPWFAPLNEGLPGEVESGMFALQAALGAGVVGYALGVLRTRSAQRREAAAGAAGSAGAAGAAAPEEDPGATRR